MRSRKEPTKIPRAVLSCLTVCFLASLAPHTDVLAQQPQREGYVTMERRIEEDLRLLGEVKECEAAKTALQNLQSDITANLIIVTSKDSRDQSGTADRAVNAALHRGAEVLGRFAQQSGQCDDARARALDLKNQFEQLTDTLAAVRQFTNECGEGDSVLTTERCRQLQPVLNEEEGREVFDPPPPVTAPPPLRPPPHIIRPGFVVKLRGPFVPRTIPTWQEDVRVTDPIGQGQCVVIFKETRGLMLRLIFVRMTVVLDPWATPALARGTRIPVWTLQWVPAEYVKEWNICNVGGAIRKTVTQRVVQDVPLTYFWRYYPKDP